MSIDSTIEKIEKSFVLAKSKEKIKDFTTENTEITEKRIIQAKSKEKIEDCTRIADYTTENTVEIIIQAKSKKKIRDFTTENTEEHIEENKDIEMRTRGKDIKRKQSKDINLVRMSYKFLNIMRFGINRTGNKTYI